MRTAVGERNFQGGKRRQNQEHCSVTFTGKKKKKAFKTFFKFRITRNFLVQIEKYEGNFQGLAKNEI